MDDVWISGQLAANGVRRFVVSPDLRHRWKCRAPPTTPPPLLLKQRAATLRTRRSEVAPRVAALRRPMPTTVLLATRADGVSRLQGGYAVLDAVRRGPVQNDDFISMPLLTACLCHQVPFDEDQYTMTPNMENVTTLDHVTLSKPKVK